ncbi:MAG TPA: HAD-IIIC family phosphatase [Streptosporangiaceae bacterium]
MRADAMNTGQTLLDDVRSAVAGRRVPGPEARQALATMTDPAVMRRAGRLLVGLDPEECSLPEVRVAIVATCTIGAYENLLRAALVGGGVLPVIKPGVYGTFEMSIATAAFAEDGDPDIVALLIDESYFLPRDWDAADEAVLTGYLRARLETFGSLVASCVARSRATVVLHTVPIPNEVLDTVISWHGRALIAQAWHQLNAGLLGLAEEHSHVMAIDLAARLADAPFPARDDRMRQYGDIPYTDGSLLILAQQVRRAVQAKLGLSRKVLALDLDNTLWGGVVGEVGGGGLELGGLYPGNCYAALQRTVRRLREQGVVLVLVSRNDAEVAEPVLAEHPEVVLRPEAFSVRAVNWSAKTENMRRAARTLNLPIRSFVFMDDSDLERWQVSTELPDVAVVSAAGEPAYLIRSLVQHGWFDVMRTTATDRQRAELYRARAERSEYETEFDTPEKYLRALEIRIEIASVTEYTIARVAQLAARTNQFNLTGIRFDETATTEMNEDSGYLVRSISVADRFGDEGIVGALWVQLGERVWTVVNMVLSCRVLGRGIEFAAVGWLARRARGAGVTALSGRYVPSGLNGVSAGFWENAGFVSAGEGEFVLDLDKFAAEVPEWITLRERDAQTI